MCNAQDFNAHEAKVMYDNFPNMASTLIAAARASALLFQLERVPLAAVAEVLEQPPSAALVDDAQQPDAFLPCGKCDICMRRGRRST